MAHPKDDPDKLDVARDVKRLPAGAMRACLAVSLAFAASAHGHEKGNWMLYTKYHGGKVETVSGLQGHSVLITGFPERVADRS